MLAQTQESWCFAVQTVFPQTEDWNLNGRNHGMLLTSTIDVQLEPVSEVPKLYLSKHAITTILSAFTQR